MSKISTVPDDQFALVFFDGGTKLKKFATVDKGNTLLSVGYFLKTAHVLPPEVIKTAATNLWKACLHFNLSIHPELESMAKTGSVSGKSQVPFLNTKVNRIQFPEIAHETGPKQTEINPRLGEHDAVWDDVAGRTNASGSPGSNFMELPAFSQKEKVKTAAPEGAEVVTKDKEWRETSYYDLTGWDPDAAYVDDAPAAQDTLLEGQYPVDSYDQVKTASVYFHDNWKQMPPADRHQYCVKLAAKMSKLGMAVPDEVARYGATTYSADVDTMVEARRGYVTEDAYSAIDLLLEKRAQVSPETFAVALEEFDKQANLNWYWDSEIPDPWFSTFGPSLEKVAEESWSYDHGGTRIGLAELEVLARNGHERLTKSFGADFAKEFSKNPKAVFNSLPDPNKLILARLASDRHYGGYTE
jgi:hypothetical protein